MVFSTRRMFLRGVIPMGNGDNRIGVALADVESALDVVRELAVRTPVLRFAEEDGHFAEFGPA